jgi:hypothetical protein
MKGRNISSLLKGLSDTLNSRILISKSNYFRHKEVIFCSVLYELFVRGTHYYPLSNKRKYFMEYASFSNLIIGRKLINSGIPLEDFACVPCHRLVIPIYKVTYFFIIILNTKAIILNSASWETCMLVNILFFNTFTITRTMHSILSSRYL